MPEQFSELLRVIGCGSIGESSYSIYGGLVEPCEIYSEEDAAELSGIMLFGDDFAGWCAGFVMATGCVVEIDPSEKHVEELADDLYGFIFASISNFFLVIDLMVGGCSDGAAAVGVMRYRADLCHRQSSVDRLCPPGSPPCSDAPCASARSASVLLAF